MSRPVAWYSPVTAAGMTVRSRPFGWPRAAPTVDRFGSCAAKRSGAASMSGDQRTATSSDGSKRTTLLSTAWLPRVTRTVLPPATTCALVTTYPLRTTNPVPVRIALQAMVETRAVLASAGSAMARAWGLAGTSTGGAGKGSRPTNTSGSPLASISWPMSPAISVSGGRYALRFRMTVEV